MVKIFKCVEGSRSSMMDVEDEHNHMRAAFGLRYRFGKPADFRRTEVQPLQHQRHGIALGSQSSLYLAAQPICRIPTTLQRGGGEQD